jgi:eukaryotic-like serine/threonine-protein kinase
VVKPALEKDAVIDGFQIEERVHVGGMATLWRVSRAGSTMPMLMKVPKIAEGADPAAIVSFEMEQMIMPRLSGVHVPEFVAAGDFAVQPYIVMERISGTTLLPRLRELPLPYDEVAEIGAKVAAALDDLHRQHVIHLDVKPSNILFRPSGDAVLVD